MPGTQPRFLELMKQADKTDGPDTKRDEKKPKSACVGYDLMNVVAI